MAIDSIDSLFNKLNYAATFDLNLKLTSDNCAYLLDYIYDLKVENEKLRIELIKYMGRKKVDRL